MMQRLGCLRVKNIRNIFIHRRTLFSETVLQYAQVNNYTKVLGSLFLGIYYIYFFWFPPKIKIISVVNNPTYFYFLLLGNFVLSYYMLVYFLGVHDYGLPWSATVVLTGVVLRILASPTHIFAEKLYAKQTVTVGFLRRQLIKVCLLDFVFLVLYYLC